MAYSASKFGLRGVAHALRESLRLEGIAVTCINLGDIGVIETQDGVVSARGFDDRTLLNPHSVLELVRCVLMMDNSSCVKEIDLPALTDRV